MNIEETEAEIIVELENQRVHYSKEEWCDEENLIREHDYIRVKEWKRDLIENYGVDLNELQD